MRLVDIPIHVAVYLLLHHGSLLAIEYGWARAPLHTNAPSFFFLYVALFYLVPPGLRRLSAWTMGDARARDRSGGSTPGDADSQGDSKRE
jgi:hypothetical protein